MRDWVAGIYDPHGQIFQNTKLLTYEVISFFATEKQGTHFSQKFKEISAKYKRSK